MKHYLIKMIVVSICLLSAMNGCRPAVDCSLNNINTIATIKDFQVPDSMRLADKIAINLSVENPNSRCIQAIRGSITAIKKDTFLIAAQVSVTPNYKACQCLSDSILHTTVFFEPKVGGAFVFVSSDLDGSVSNGVFFKKIIVQ